MMSRGQIPTYMETDHDAILAAIRTCVETDFLKPRVARIKNTLQMTEILVSEALYEDIRDRNDVELISGPEEMPFDPKGFLLKDTWNR